MHSVQQALDLILSSAKSFGTEKVSIHNAYNRVLAEDICADRDYPPFNRSAMDGYAVIANDFASHEKCELQVIGKVYAGAISNQKVIAGTCMKIMTGAPVPTGADAVIRVEDSIEENGIVAFKSNVVLPGQNIAFQAEDAKKGNLLIRRNIILNTLSIPVLAVLGMAEIVVYKNPDIAIVSTGNEIIPVGNAILPHQIRDSNSYSLSSFFKLYSINSILTTHASDDKDMLKESLSKLLDKDILILSGGVSKGDADYVPEVLVALGVEEVFHKVKIKPGSPLWFGKRTGGGVVFGLPGNPVAVQVAFKVFIEPYLRKCFNMEPLQPMYLPLLRGKPKKIKFDEYFPCRIVTENKVTGLIPEKMNGSGDIAATIGSDGLAIHPAESDTLKESTVIEFYSWK